MRKEIKKLFLLITCSALLCALALTALPVTSSAASDEKSVTIITSTKETQVNGYTFTKGDVTIAATGYVSKEGVYVEQSGGTITVSLPASVGYITKVEYTSGGKLGDEPDVSFNATGLKTKYKGHILYVTNDSNNSLTGLTMSCTGKRVVIEKVKVYYHEHTWKVSYVWNTDGSKCVGMALCSDCNKLFEANGTITSAEKTPATSTEKGTTTYTATFSDSRFTTQTLDVQDIKMTISASDFEFNTYTAEYDGQPHSASVSCGLTDVGEITYRYFDSNGSELNTVPVNAGTYTVKIDVGETENRQGAVGLTGDNWKYTIAPAEVGGTPEDKGKIYGEVDPELTVTWRGLIGDDIPDYTITREPGEDAGTYKITISGDEYQENYHIDFSSTGEFTITPKSIGSCTVEGFTLNFVENGKELQPKPVVKDGDKVLTEGKDYTLEYADNITAGTATITVKGKGNYGETATVNFTIVKAEASGIQDFTKGQAESDAVVTIGEGTVLKLSDFKRVLVDGNELSSDYYTAEDGCIKITLLKSYLNTLKTGTHTLTVELGEEYDGVTCQTSFKVKSASPATGDDSNVALWGAMLSVAGAAVVMTGKKRKED